MTWRDPPPIVPTKAKAGKRITPEQLAASGTEDGHQAAVFCWAADSVGTYPALAYMFAIPNGGEKNIIAATKFVATGTRSGVVDIFLPVWKIGDRKVYHGCFIEMKLEKYRNRKNGGCSDEQIDFIEYVVSAGYYVKVCYNWEEARDTLIAYLEGKL